jgi:hypothetical protein
MEKRGRAEGALEGVDALLNNVVIELQGKADAAGEPPVLDADGRSVEELCTADSALEERHRAIELLRLAEPDSPQRVRLYLLRISFDPDSAVRLSALNTFFDIEHGSSD